MFYATGNEKTKEDFEVLLQELTAYLELGNGHEDAYLKNDIKIIESILRNWQRKYISGQCRTHKLNRYERKKITQQRYKRLHKLRWWTVYYKEEENRYIKIFYSGRRKYAKYCSNRKVRNSNEFSLRGGGYRRVYDFWWTVF